jgi:hypothetical protein
MALAADSAGAQKGPSTVSNSRIIDVNGGDSDDSESDDLYGSYPPNNAHSNPKPLVPTPVLDLAKSVKGMYRILDLITEQGSGGLGEKHSPSLHLRSSFSTKLIKSLSRKTPCENLSMLSVPAHTLH